MSNSNDDGLAPEKDRKMFIGGLNYETTDETLKSYFDQFGEIVDCIVMKDSLTRRSRGFGFVAFKDPANVEKVQESRPHIIDGKEVDTKRATPREDADKPGSHASVKKIFVGGLKDGMTSDILQQYFEQYGTINHVQIMEDSKTGHMRGFGFVTFDNFDAVDKVVGQKFHQVSGQSIEVKKALSRAEMNAAEDRMASRQRGYGRNQGGGWGNQGGYQNYQGNYSNQGYGSGYSGPQAYEQSYGGGYSQQQNWGGMQGGWNTQSSGYGNQAGASWESYQQGGYQQAYSQGGGPMGQDRSYSQRGSGPYGANYGSQGSYQQRR